MVPCCKSLEYTECVIFSNFLRLSSSLLFFDILRTSVLHPILSPLPPQPGLVGKLLYHTLGFWDNFLLHKTFFRFWYSKLCVSLYFFLMVISVVFSSFFPVFCHCSSISFPLIMVLCLLVCAKKKRMIFASD